MKAKPYCARSLKGAEREVRRLRKQREELLSLLEKYDTERKAMAKLADDELLRAIASRRMW